jgi:uncharacterized phage protein gp47/JayE
MPLPQVTEKGVNDQIIATVESQIGQTIPLLGKAFARVMAAAFAGLIVLLYKYNNYTFLQMFVATASNIATTVNGQTVIPLQAWGVLVGAGRPVAAIAAELDLTVTVTNPTAAVIDAGTQFVSGDNGVTYLSTAPVSILGTSITIPVVAAGDQSNNAGTGTIGNLDPGAVVSFVTTPVGVLQAAVVDVQTVTAADAETDAAYRQRVIDRFQKRAQGGALVDYELWGEETAGIINEYPYAWTCPGGVEVYAEATVASSGNPDGFPTQAQLDAVADSINLDLNGRATRRQVNAFLVTNSITRKGFTVTVVGLEADDSGSVMAEVETALDSHFKTFEPFIGGVSVIRRDRVTQASVAGVVSAVITAAGGTFVDVLLSTGQVVEQVFAGRTLAGDDDAEEDGGIMAVGGASVTMGGAAHLVGFRIPNVSIPAGSVVQSATLELSATALNNTYSEFSIHGEASATPAAYTAAANDISDRDQTVAAVPWIPPGWAAASLQTTPDLTAVVQEVVDLAGWATNNAMAFIITGTDDSDREVDTFEAGPSLSPLLTVAFQLEVPTLEATTAYTLGRGEKARLDSVVYS